MAKKDKKEKFKYGIEEKIGRFVIKTDKGFYKARNDYFEMKEIYVKDKTEGKIFKNNIIALWFMENLKEPIEKEIIEL